MGPYMDLCGPIYKYEGLRNSTVAPPVSVNRYINELVEYVYRFGQLMEQITEPRLPSSIYF